MVTAIARKAPTPSLKAVPSIRLAEPVRNSGQYTRITELPMDLVPVAPMAPVTPALCEPVSPAATAKPPVDLESELSTMDKLLLQTVFAAVKEGDFDSVKEMLEILSENATSLQPVMFAITARLAKLNISAGVETIAQSRDKYEIRIHLSGDLGGGWGTITMSSTGVHSAVVWGYKDLAGRIADAKTTFSALMMWTNLQ